MNGLFRFLMGIAVLFILVPAIAMTMPDVFNDLNPWGGEESQTEATQSPIILAAPDESPLFAEDSASTAARSSEPDTPSSGLVPGDPVLPSMIERDETTTRNPLFEETTTSSSSKQTTKPEAPKSGGGTPPTTASPSPPTTGGHSPVVTGTITGNACPCTVTGTVELKGDISLTGDLMVMGGTLVARPGVNVNGNGHQIMFMNGGRADFHGSETSTWSGNGSNANLTRDVVFRNMLRLMFHQGAGKSTIKYIAINDSGGPNLGEYPLHFHKNGNSTRGTIVEGVVVLNGKHHAYVPHGSHGITFRNTIAVNTMGPAYWWDPGRGDNCSNDILYDHTLADGVTNNPGDNRGFQLSAFRLGCGSGNIIKNSIARNVNPSHKKNCSGFHWPENDEGVWGFFNNASYGSECNGIFVWQNTSDAHIINGFSGDGIENGAYLNQYIYKDIDVEFVIAHALGRGVSVVFENGSIGTVLIPKHTLEGDPILFKNLQIGTFSIDNGGGSVPGTYILENTNVTCGDIQYESVAAGTQVIVNGGAC